MVLFCPHQVIFLLSLPLLLQQTATLSYRTEVSEIIIGRLKMLDLTLTEQTARAYDSLKCLIFLNTDTERYVVLRDMTACNVWKSRVGMRYKYSVQLTENGRCDFECCIKVAYMQVSGRLKTLQLCG